MYFYHIRAKNIKSEYSNLDTQQIGISKRLLKTHFSITNFKEERKINMILPYLMVSGLLDTA